MVDRVNILGLLEKANFEKQEGNIEIAIKTLKEAKQLLLNVDGSQCSNRNDTSEGEKEIIYLHKFGNILYEIEDYKKSLKYFEEIAEKHPKPKVNICKALGDCLRKLERYDEALERYNEGLEAYEDDMSACSEDKAAIYNSKGLTYVDKGQNVDALKEFEKAIKTQKRNPLYYCNKGSILLDITGKKEECLKCFNKAIALVDQGEVEGLTNRNATYILRIVDHFIETRNNVEKLQTKYVRMKAKLEEIQSKGVSDEHLLEEFTELENCINDFNEFKKLLNKLTTDKRNFITKKETQLVDYLKDLDEIKTCCQLHKNRIQELETKVQSHTEDIAVIKEQLLNFIPKDEFEKLKSTCSQFISLYGNRLQILETDVDGQKKMMVHIDETLKEANVFIEVEIKKKLEDLKTDHGSEVHEYATKFYRTLSDCLLAYQLISIGLIKENEGGFSSIIKKISEGLGLSAKYFPSLKTAEEAIGVINGFFEKYANVKVVRTAKKVADSISGFILPKDFDMAVANSAIDIAKIKASDIMLSKEKKPEGIDKAKEWFSSKLDKLELKITKIPSVSKSEINKMVLEDVVLFIYSIVKSDDKLVGNNEDVNKLSQKIVTQFKNDVGIKQLLDELYKEAENAPRTLKNLRKAILKTICLK